MAAKETVIGKFVNQILFKVDKSSVDDAKSAISEVKGFAAKALGAIGICFSFTKLASLAEEFGSINDTIRGATREMGDQADIQQKILQGAQDCREEYGVMAGDVTKLVQLNSKLFPVDDAVKFVSLVEKLEKGSGREANLDNTMSVLQKAISSGKLDKSGFSNLKTAAPEVVKAISSAMGVSEKQLQNLAESGKLSAKQLKEAFFAAESDIQKNFDELGFGIGDALTYVRNQWGLWLAGADDMLGTTTSIGKAIKTISDFLIGKAQRLTSWLKNIAEKLGGVEQLLKLIVMVATALFLATNGSKILSFLAGAVKLLQGFNLQTALAAAKWLLLFLVLEDVFTFLQGGDSVFGRLLSEAGVDVDALREKISAFFEGAKQFGRDALDSLGQFWEEHKGTILVVLQALWQGLVDLTADIITLGGHLFDLLAGLITGFQTGDWTQFLTGCKELWQDFLDILNGLGRAAFGETWEPLKESAQAIWDWLKGFFDWFGDKITWAKNLWNGVKNFFTGGNDDGSDDSDGGDGSDKNPSGFSGMGGGKSSGGSGRTSSGNSPTGVQTSSGSTAASRNAASAFISGGRPVSTTTASQRPIAQTTNTKNITVKQENRQSYMFQVSDRNAASKLQSTVSSQSSQSTKDLAHHQGYDLVGITDKNIYCPVYGTVVRAGWECATLPKKGFGRRVVVRIGTTAYYMYFGHLSKISVTAGQKLKPGDLIGVEGSTGHSTGSHLHWEIRINDIPTGYVSVYQYAGIPNVAGATAYTANWAAELFGPGNLKKSTSAFPQRIYNSVLQGALGIDKDGIFGANTEKMVKEFQEKQSLTVDGIVGSKTKAALFKLI